METTTLCENCGREIEAQEGHACALCGLDPLCIGCIYELDHDCTMSE